MEFNIRPASPADADYLAEVILGAIGDEHILHMAGTTDRISLVKEVFKRLAEREDSQYSFRNSIIALDKNGKYAGAVISYDGERLKSLRKAFIEEANSLLGWNLEEKMFTDETSPDEYYLDSLMVSPDYRHQGLGSRLIMEAHNKALEIGKPLGLLVDFNNPNAKRLYQNIGFKSSGIRPFAGKDMEHLLLN